MITINDLIECGCTEKFAKVLNSLQKHCKDRSIKTFFSYSAIENLLLPYTKSFGGTNKANDEWAQTFINSIQPLYNI